jgi:hypothetical protein
LIFFLSIGKGYLRRSFHTTPLEYSNDIYIIAIPKFEDKVLEHFYDSVDFVLPCQPQLGLKLSQVEVVVRLLQLDYLVKVDINFCNAIVAHLEKDCFEIGLVTNKFFSACKFSIHARNFQL